MKNKAMVVEFDPESPYIDVTVNGNRHDGTSSLDGGDEAFWRQYLEGMGSGTFLPFSLAGPGHARSSAGPGLAGSGISQKDLLVLDREQAGKLLTLSHRLGISAGTVCMGVWSYLLHRYTGEKNIFFGVKAASNILPFKGTVESSSAIGPWLQEVGADYTKNRQHARPLEEILPWSGVTGGLFDTVIILEATVHAPEGESGALILGLSVGEEIRIVFRYPQDRLDHQQVETIRGHFQHVLLQMIHNPEGRLGDLSLLTPAEEDQILQVFNKTFADYPQEKGLLQLWDAQVQKTPDAVALHYDQRRVTWKELNQQSTRLAAYLQGRGVKAETRVPICMDRSVEMIVGILGILKAGAAYVPIDPEYPEERVQYILEDIHADLIVADRSFSIRFPTTTGLPIIVPGEDDQAYMDPLLPAGVEEVTDRVICTIYTSGSTGNPKGVRVGDQGIVNRLYWMWNAYPFEPQETVVWKTSLSFVDHVWEIFGPLTAGVPSVLLTRDDLLDPDILIEKLSFHGITRWVLVPSLLRALLTRLQTGREGLERLKYWTCSGEALPASLVKDFYAIFPASEHKLLNIYGSTEVTADVTCYDTSLYVSSTGNAHADARLPIGRPIANTRIYIIDSYGALAPVGVPGEIVVGGVAVALGYWNRPGLTAEKFVPDPFSGTAGKKMYRTGDIGRWMPDGNIEYIGRSDQQVKIRGYRVELGEIETALQQSKLVRQAVVLAREDEAGHRRLVGYIEGSFDKAAVIAWLRRQLPEYMIPLDWVELEKYPLTVNGKIDRRSLPEPGTGNDNTTVSHYALPRNEVERALVKIWEDLLGIVAPGIHDNFFERGGDSLLTMRLITLIRRSLKAETTIRILFEYPTIAGQAAFILGSTEDKQRSVDQRSRCITPIRDEGSNIPLFVMPDRMTYDKLGNYLQGDQPLYCLEMIPDVSIEENARHFIAEMKLIQPNGPYNLGGHCGSGLIALEMGRQLLAEGEEVQILVLFESYGPEAVLPWTSPRYWLGKVKLYQELLSPLSLRQKMIFPFKEIKRIYKGVGEFDKEYKASLKPYQGNVLLFRASIQDTYYYKNDPLMGWKGHISGKIESIEIEGDHLSIIHEEPGVGQIAQKLKEVLGQKGRDVHAG